VVILEVGLGGRLDATNIVDADVAVVTSIALDHTDWLGPDRESIGREKAGIFRAGKPAVVGEPDMPHTIAEVAAGKGARFCAATSTGAMTPVRRRGHSATGRDAGGFAVAADSAAECGNGAGGAARQPTSGERAGDSRRY
jgi:folylpolyglutamate synthase/dihydropteroate synthase